MAHATKKTANHGKTTPAHPVAARRRTHSAPPALAGWLLSQRDHGAADATAHQLARSIKRNLFAE